MRELEEHEIDSVAGGCSDCDPIEINAPVSVHSWRPDFGNLDSSLAPMLVASFEMI